jgi:hypothetical protein
LTRAMEGGSLKRSRATWSSHWFSAWSYGDGLLIEYLNFTNETALKVAEWMTEADGQDR